MRVAYLAGESGACRRGVACFCNQTVLQSAGPALVQYPEIPDQLDREIADRGKRQCKNDHAEEGRFPYAQRPIEPVQTCGRWGIRQASAHQGIANFVGKPPPEWEVEGIGDKRRDDRRGDHSALENTLHHAERDLGDRDQEGPEQANGHAAGNSIAFEAPQIIMNDQVSDRTQPA